MRQGAAYRIYELESGAYVTANEYFLFYQCLNGSRYAANMNMNILQNATYADSVNTQTVNCGYGSMGQRDI
jgi:hypothetical protein